MNTTQDDLSQFEFFHVDLFDQSAELLAEERKALSKKIFQFMGADDERYEALSTASQYALEILRGIVEECSKNPPISKPIEEKTDLKYQPELVRAAWRHQTQSTEPGCPDGIREVDQLYLCLGSSRIQEDEMQDEELRNGVAEALKQIFPDSKGWGEVSWAADKYGIWAAKVSMRQNG